MPLASCNSAVRHAAAQFIGPCYSAGVSCHVRLSHYVLLGISKHKTTCPGACLPGHTDTNQAPATENIIDRFNSTHRCKKHLQVHDMDDGSEPQKHFVRTFSATWIGHLLRTEPTESATSGCTEEPPKKSLCSNGG